MKCLLVIPTYNGGDVWKKTAENINKYGGSDLFVQVVDSGSSDETCLIAKKYGFHISHIHSKDFNHGGTRNYALDIQKENFDIVVFLTQDSIPEYQFIDKITAVFDDQKVSCAYGKQLPHLDATPIATHARKFNYPDASHTCNLDSVPKFGLKTVFMSNSFSAYNVKIFKSLNGFPSNTIMCEDMYFAAKAVLAGYKNVYVADAVVRHSHNYSPFDEFRRYFDIGVFHMSEPWIRHEFGGAGGEGMKFILSELKYLLNHNVKYIPIAFVNNFMKILGYKLGMKCKYLPDFLVKNFSMHKGFWK